MPMSDYIRGLRERIGTEVLEIPTVSVFVADVAGGTLRPDGEETLETRYFAREDLRDVPVRTQVMLYLDAAWAHESTVHFQKPTWRPPSA